VVTTLTQQNKQQGVTIIDVTPKKSLQDRVFNFLGTAFGFIMTTLSVLFILLVIGVVGIFLAKWWIVLIPLAISGVLVPLVLLIIMVRRFRKGAWGFGRIMQTIALTLFLVFWLLIGIGTSRWFYGTFIAAPVTQEAPTELQPAPAQPVPANTEAPAQPQAAPAAPAATDNAAPRGDGQTVVGESAPVATAAPAPTAVPTPTMDEIAAAIGSTPVINNHWATVDPATVEFSYDPATKKATLKYAHANGTAAPNSYWIFDGTVGAGNAISGTFKGYASKAASLKKDAKPLATGTFNEFCGLNGCTGTWSNDALGNTAQFDIALK